MDEAKAKDVLLKLTKTAAKALWHALQNRKAAGFTDLKRHAVVTRALKAACSELVDLGPNAPATEKRKEYFDFIDGELAIGRGAFKYIDKIVSEQVLKGVDGAEAHGYGELLEAMEPHIDAGELKKRAKPTEAEEDDEDN